jgi:hypothetical protein
MTKMLYENMKKERLRMCEVLMAMTAVAFCPSWAAFSLLVSRPAVKSQLAGLTLTQEAS